MKYFITLGLLLLTINYLSAPALAGCISDCKGEYESEIEDCKIMWGDDPDDSDTLESCIDDAKSEYESCVDECTS